MNLDVHPYRFPTTIVVVDDSGEFLRKHGAAPDGDATYRLFESPAEALRFLNRPERPLPLYRRCYSHYGEAAGRLLSDRLIRVDFSLLEQAVASPERFCEISVVVVNHEMEAMDGISVCAQIHDSHIKKLLLADAGSEGAVLQAFNDGVIDRFVCKSDADEQLREALSVLQQRYFSAAARLIGGSLSLEAPSFLQDPAFSGYFAELRCERGFVEHYLADEPPGFLMADRQGRLARLLVANDADLRVQWEIAVDQDCPQELADLLSSGRALPYFAETGGFYRADCHDRWQRYMHCARRLERSEYYVALIDDPPLRAPMDVFSYRDYLERLNRVAA